MFILALFKAALFNEKIIHRNYSLIILASFIDKHVFAYNYHFCCSTSTLEHTLNSLKCMINEHVFMK